ncbi:MAG TPA: MlaE family lipid ABC transporter permease subunit [Candidatus Saccharimonadia bacterium]|nr:MlaE family lipid ABC transporter permease subunit [Candidatus Saccharimonadia bacterium]
MRELVAEIGRAGVFAGRILVSLVPQRGSFADLVRQIYSIGGRTVPIVAVGGLFVGLVMSLQGYRTLSTFGASNALGTLLGLTLYRELGPVLTALLFCGRAGSSIAAELGLMRATDQIAALSMMAIDPVRKAVVPRFLAGVVAVPLLTAVFCAFAIFGGYVQAVHVLGIDAGHYWSGLQGSVSLVNDYGQAFTKALVFGAVTSLIATYAGYHAEPTIEGTSRATTQAVVSGSLMVLFLDFLLSALLY